MTDIKKLRLEIIELENTIAELTQTVNICMVILNVLRRKEIFNEKDIQDYSEQIAKSIDRSSGRPKDDN